MDLEQAIVPRWAIGLTIAIVGVAGYGVAFSHAVNAAPLRSEFKPLPAKKEKAPSKAKKPGVAAMVVVSYARKKITECKSVVDEGERYCEARGHVPSAAEARVTIVPIDKRGNDQLGARSKHRVEFGPSTETQKHPLRLPKGRWELRWKDGSTLRERFFTMRGDRFAIALEAISGMCVETEKNCELDTGKRQRSVEIPKDRDVR